MMEKGLKVEYTGAYFGMNSSEFRVTYPDGTQETIWSPNWHEYDKAEELQQALNEAARRWNEKQKA